jgi:hypothetical protein
MAEPDATDITIQQADNTADTTTPDASTKPETGETQATDWQAEAEKWKALSRKNEAQAKANADKAKQWTELQESHKSEAEKTNERITQLETELKTARTTALRSQTAAQNGLPVELLTADTEDALNAQVRALLAFKAPSVPKASTVNASQTGGTPTVYTREQVSDPEFYQKHRSDILKAMSEGRIK